MTNKYNEYHPVNLWLFSDGRSQRWLSQRLEVHENTINRWKRTGRIPHHCKLAICYVCGTSMPELFDEVL